MEKEIGVTVVMDGRVDGVLAVCWSQTFMRKQQNLSADISTIIDERINFVNFWVKVIEFYQNY